MAEIAAFQETVLREQGMWDLFQEIELPLTRVLIEMEEVGIHLDCYRLGEITGKIEDQIEGQGKKRFTLHYNFPPYSTGETGRMGGTNRRMERHAARDHFSVATNAAMLSNTGIPC